MFLNFLKVAYRNLHRNRAFSFINIFGLAIGLATCTLILLYVYSETGYDSHHKDADRVYRVAGMAKLTGGGKAVAGAAISAPMAGALQTDMPEIAAATRLLKFPTFDRMLLQNDANKSVHPFYETEGYYVDSNFFEVISYDFIYGNPHTALQAPNSMVLSETVSKKLFGDENPIGKRLTVGILYGNLQYTVQGVFKDNEIKTHIPAHFFLSMHNDDIGGWVAGQTNWANNNIFHTYIKLKPGADAAALEKKFPAFVDRRAGVDLKAAGIGRILFLQPMQDIHLHSNFDGEITANSNITYIYMLVIIAVFVLMIACINFMNLSTARSGQRAKEVGIRKVLGSERAALIRQFLSESIVMSGLALLLAMLIVLASLPFFNQLIQKELTLFAEPTIWIWIGALTLVTGFVAGLYPAFYLSSFKPIAVLKGNLMNQLSGTIIRKGLVVFQFSISIALMIGVIVIRRQLDFMDKKELGFNKSQEIIIPLQNQEAIKNYDALHDALMKQSDIRMVSSGSTYPGIDNQEDMLFYPAGKSVRDQVDVHLATVNADYMKTLGMELLAGREFSTNFVADSDNLVLNETAVRALGFDTKTVVGKTIYYDHEGGHQRMTVVGVVRDFNFESLYSPVKAFAFNTRLGNRFTYLIAHVRTDDYHSLLKQMEKTWHTVNAGLPFSFSFLDADFMRNYEKDLRTVGLVSGFTIVAILIACLGLFGLSAFSAEQRKKEIGIRKVLGASVSSVTLLLSKEFLRLVAIAMLIAFPIAYFGMNRWLQNFAYRTAFSWWIFTLAGCTAMLIALATVSFQALKAGFTNPVKNLREG